MKGMGSMKRLTRSQDKRLLAGVCAGIADYLNIDPTIVRLITVILAIPTSVFPMVLVYIVAMLLMPIEENG
ncbi:PspC domain-containing protein [Shouchella clausii]|nr:PspC domain-containing protein [Shouchella clausii]SPT80907.1 phage shock protein C [Niallia circulans]MCM3550373.1 PspC domain-containing protein [Shouchella clausii]MCY1105203.1 PspC domain-containing protein [Shouchella clausii]MEB5473685.1 PspC domain-containing protein [Shouchella clausii]MEB5478563.1 PspC domain-containing protein [Shouchella clausii]